VEVGFPNLRTEIGLFDGEWLFMGRRGRGVAGLSLAASAGLLGTYVGYPGLRKAHAATPCEVQNTNDAGAGSLRQCLTDIDAAGGGTITFADSANGTITLASNLPEVELESMSSVTVTGNGEDNTIIDGDGPSESAAGFFFTGSGTVTLTGLTIRNTSPLGNGRENSNGEDVLNGGAVFSSAGGVNVDNSTFEGNVANLAGAIYATGGNVSVTDSSFTSNTALDFGGAILINNGAVSVGDSTFENNTAGDDGGAIFTYGANDAVEVSSSTFTGNTATDGDGGAIKSRQSSVTVARSTFASNEASNNGGAIDGYSSGSVVNSTFTGNSSGNDGGAIYLYANNAPLELSFVTVTQNTTGTNGKGAVQAGKLNGASVENSIVYGNTGDDVYVVNDGTLSVSHSLFSSSSSVYPTVSGASLIFGEDPLLGSLADNGGPTQTMLPAADSPVIGTANPVGAPSTDQRGFSRTTDGLADMGAVQVGGVAPEPDLSQVPPSWLQAQGREESEAVCPPGMAPSWAQWPNEGTGGWTCEYTTWWDVNEGVGGGWVTTPGFR